MIIVDIFNSIFTIIMANVIIIIIILQYKGHNMRKYDGKRVWKPTKTNLLKKNILQYIQLHFRLKKTLDFFFLSFAAWFLLSYFFFTHRMVIFQ